MATVLDQQQLAVVGIGPAYTVADAEGMSVNNARGCVLHVRNGGGTACTLTIVPTRTVDGLALKTLVATVPAGAARFYGPIPVRLLDSSGVLAFVPAGANLAALDVAVLTAVPVAVPADPIE